MLREAPPSNAVFALGGGGCVNCTLGFRSARWGIELDGAFSAINAGQEPDECDCIISERRLCFQNVGADIVPNYRCQVQVDVGSDLVECGFQVQLASELCTGFDGCVLHIRHPIAAITNKIFSQNCLPTLFVQCT